MFFKYQTLFLSLCLLFSINSHAASFDCKKAETPTEKTICADKNLSDLDSKLSVLWKSFTSFDTSSMQPEQQAWMKQRNACGKAIKCLTTSYQTRLTALQKLKNPQSCTDQVGKKDADMLVAWCLNASSATRPPCNAENSCDLIVEHIQWSCKEFTSYVKKPFYCLLTYPITSN